MSMVDHAFLRAYETAASPTQAAQVISAMSIKSEQVQPPSPPAPHFARRQATAAAPSSSSSAAARRPLSTFAAKAPAVEARFQPSLEVAAFRWPAAVAELSTAHAARWQNAVRALVEADAAGCSLVGVVGAGPGAGATTAALALARLLVEAGKTIALVDGDFRTAQLASQLGVSAEIGWEDVLAGRAPLAEAMVHSQADRLALLPLVHGGIPAAEKLDAIHASVTAGVLRYHYDIVLFDLGDATDEVQGPIARRIARECRLDGALVVAANSRRRFDQNHFAAAAPELAGLCLGVIENGM